MQLALLTGIGWWILHRIVNTPPDNGFGILVLILGFCVTPLMLDSTIRFILYRIEFYEDRLFTSGTKYIVTFSDRKFRTQHKTEIFYADIESIGVLYVNKNSRKRTMPLNSTGGLRANLFYTFTLKNGKTKWLYISTFSKKQRLKMLDLINLYANTNFSYETMEKTDDSYFNFKKRKKKEE